MGDHLLHNGHSICAVGDHLHRCNPPVCAVGDHVLPESKKDQVEETPESTQQEPHAGCTVLTLFGRRTERTIKAIDVPGMSRKVVTFARLDAYLKVSRCSVDNSRLEVREFSRTHLGVLWLSGAATHRKKEGTEDSKVKPGEEPEYSGFTVPVGFDCICRMCCLRSSCIPLDHSVLAVWRTMQATFGRGGEETRFPIRHQRSSPSLLAPKVTVGHRRCSAKSRCPSKDGQGLPKHKRAREKCAMATRGAQRIPTQGSFRFTQFLLERAEDLHLRVWECLCRVWECLCHNWRWHREVFQVVQGSALIRVQAHANSVVRMLVSGVWSPVATSGL